MVKKKMTALILIKKDYKSLFYVMKIYFCVSL
jgi:hypothetical protein